MGIRENKFLTGLVLLIMYAAVQCSFAGPMVLPDSARPGAVPPKEAAESTPPPNPVAGGIEVPAVIDRPFEIDAGPTVIVSQFRLLDARDLPEFGISRSEIQTLLEQHKQDFPDGFTIGQLQEAADIVTQYYREKGLILAQSVVPVQNVTAGIVDFQIYEGKLGNVLTEGNLSYTEAMLGEVFADLLGEPITKNTIEAALLQLTDLPGLSVFGVFQPGKQVGTADIVLKVQDEDRFQASYRADNHGLQETGRVRWRTSVDWNNPTWGGDKLSLTIQQTYRPKNNQFVSIDYERYLAPGWKAGGFIQKNHFDVGGEFSRLKISGLTDQFGLWLNKDWVRSRQFNFSSRLSLTKIDSDSLSNGNQNNRDRLAVLSLELQFDHVDTRFKGINFATLEYSRGFNNILGAMGSNKEAQNTLSDLRPSRQAGDGRYVAGQFSKVFATASRLQTLWANASLLSRFELQWTNDFLTSIEQYSVGGPDNVRAFPQAQFLLDRAAFFSIEYINNLPFITDKIAFANRTWGELVQLSAFYDHAIGRLQNPLFSEQQGYLNFRGAGVQARFNLPGSIESRLMWAWELSGDNTEFPSSPKNGRQPQIWGDFTYRF